MSGQSVCFFAVALEMQWSSVNAFSMFKGFFCPVCPAFRLAFCTKAKRSAYLACFMGEDRGCFCRTSCTP